MKSRQVASAGDESTHFLVFDKGDEVVAVLTRFAQDRGIAAAHFVGIGSFSAATLAYFDRGVDEYRHISVPEQVEVVSFTGDIGLQDGQPKVHGHAIVGRRDGTTLAGHVLEAHVWPTLELRLDCWPGALRRVPDPDTGLALIDPGA